MRLIGLPGKRISPSVGSSRPIMCFSSTLLPVPLLPMMVVVWPSWISRFTRSRIVRLPKLLVTFLNSISGGSIDNSENLTKTRLVLGLGLRVDFRDALLKRLDLVVQ